MDANGGIVPSLRQAFNNMRRGALRWIRRRRHLHRRTLEPRPKEQQKPPSELPLGSSSESGKFTASFSQQALWLVHQLDPTSSAYNLPLGLRLRGPLDYNLLKLSLQAIIDRHDILRTRLELGETEVVQIVLQNYTVQLPLLDLSHLSESSRYAEADELALGETQVLFDLSQVPLFRLTLVRLAPADHILVCVLHHAISDAWSLELFVKELTILYNAFSTRSPSPLAPLPIQYGDYSQWQREWMAGGVLHGQIDYWRKKLRGAPPVLLLPADRVRPPKQTFEGASSALPLSKELVRHLKSLSAQQNATLFMITLAAFQVLLSRYSGQHDILVGVPIAGRSRLEAEAVIGFFVNMLALRTDLSGNPQFCDLLTQVREVVLGGLCNSDVPFVKLIEELRPVRSPSYNPIFQVIFSVIKSAVQSGHLGGLHASPYVFATRSSRVDLTMNLIECADEQWVVQFEYNTMLFDRERIMRMLDDYISVLRAVVAEPHLHISDLPLLTVCD
jgi:hypothetical protein